MRVLFALALSDEQYTHILLILPISAALIFVDWKGDLLSREQSFGSGKALACVSMLLAILVNAVMRWESHLAPDVQLATNILALVTWWIASFVLCFEARTARLAIFPLGFLLWMVPLPESAVNSIVTFLQYGSAAAAHLLFAAVGMPVAQRGLLVHIPGLTLEVAPECSSIRSSLILMVTTMVLAQLLLRSTWRKVLVVAASIPLSIAKNGLRIFTLGVLATRVDPGYLTGRLHHQGGVIFFLIAVSATVILLWILRRGETKSAAKSAAIDAHGPQPKTVRLGA